MNNTTTLDINLQAIGIGSLPDKDLLSACQKVFQYFPTIPHWPELPNLGFRQQMGYSQIEPLPLATDLEKGRLYWDTNRDYSEKMAELFEHYLASDLNYFAYTEKHAAGLIQMLRLFSDGEVPDSVKAVKCQLTGPTTLGFIIKDDQGKPLLYQDQLMDVLVKLTAMKAKWMEYQFSQLGYRTLIFFDEPMLQSIGSASVPIDRAQAISMLNEVCQSVESLTGAHCCGNTDWSLLMESEVDIIAFDAYDFAKTMSLYSKQLTSFLDRGGYLVWGIIPSRQEAISFSSRELYQRLVDEVNQLAKTGIDIQQLWQALMISPSCGLGTLSIELAEDIMQLTAGVQKQLVKESE
jgi:methionine synthase II (cobalamin-independent)